MIGRKAELQRKDIERKMEDEDIIRKEDLPEELVKNPYKTILSWSERRFKKIGEKVFSFLALIPHSIFIPPIPYEDDFFRVNLSFLLLTPAGGAKTKIAKAIEEIVINPVSFEDITSAELQTELAGKEEVTLITGDAGRILKDFDLIKAIEGVLSDSRVSKRNKREQLDYEIIGNLCMAGTPQDLTAYLGSGLLSRIIVMVLLHSKDEQDEIGKEIVDSIGLKSKQDVNIQDIKNYYRWLYQIQKGLSKDFNPIKGYYFNEEFKSKIYNLWKNYREKAKVTSFENFYRELIGGIKFLCCSAFLNINNREIKNGLLVPNEEDLRIALYLMHQELKTKIHILRNEKIARRIKDVAYLEKVATQYRISKFNLDMIKLLIESREK